MLNLFLSVSLETNQGSSINLLHFWSHDQDLKNPGPSMCLGVMITRKRNHNNVAKKINKISLDLYELFPLKLYTKIQHRSAHPKSW